MRIAVAGGGTAGAAAALFLARDGHRVELFERVAAPGTVGTGILLQPTGLAALRELGVYDAALAHGARVGRLYGETACGRAVMDLHYRDWRADAFGLGMHRGTLFSLLWNALAPAGVALHGGCEIREIAAESGGLHALAGADGRRYTGFDAVVIADGTRSRLRACCFPEARAAPYPWGALWAILPDPGRRFADTLEQRYRGTRQMAGILPTGRLPGDATPLVSLFWSLRNSDLEACRATGLDAWKDSVTSLWPQLGGLIAQIERFDQLAFAQYSDVRLPAWHRGAIAIIGDAAHATSPQLGQGANLALLDARVLRDCLRELAEPGPAFASYSRRRRAHLRYYQFASRWLTPLFQSDSRVAGWARDACMGPLARFPGAALHFQRTLVGVKTGLVFGALVVD